MCWHFHKSVGAPSFAKRNIRSNGLPGLNVGKPAEEVQKPGEFAPGTVL
jgi:hypothetical protein